MYKEGDKVLCIKSFNSYRMTVGNIYTIGGKYYGTHEKAIAITKDESGVPNAFYDGAWTVVPATNLHKVLYT